METQTLYDPGLLYQQATDARSWAFSSLAVAYQYHTASLFQCPACQLLRRGLDLAGIARRALGVMTVLM